MTETNQQPGLTPQELAEIRARAEKATLPPWIRGIGNQCREVSTKNGLLIATFRDPTDGTWAAAARQDIPSLLAYIAGLEERERELVEAIRQGIKGYTEEQLRQAQAAIAPAEANERSK